MLIYSKNIYFSRPLKSRIFKGNAGVPLKMSVSSTYEAGRLPKYMREQEAQRCKYSRHPLESRAIAEVWIPLSMTKF
jgi:hypothetical protein